MTTNALCSIALAHFNHLHSTHPGWHLEDLLQHLNLRPSKELAALAAQAGFKEGTEPTPDEVLRVARVCILGISSPQIIAKESGLPVERVQKILGLYSGGYGTSPYGKAPYGGNRKFSKDGNAVPRRVTVQGQLSYRGKKYTLGVAYRGRRCEVRERRGQLVLTFGDRRPLYLTRRPEKHDTEVMTAES